MLIDGRHCMMELHAFYREALMSRIIRFGLAMPCALLLACTPQSTDQAATDSAAAAALVDPAAVRQAVEAANATATAALNKGDVEAWLTAYAPDAIVMLPNQPAWRGHEGIRTGAQGMLSEVTLSGVTFTSEDLQVAEDFAFETGRYEMTMTPKKGKATVDRGKYITVWQRQADGSWKIIRDISNSDLPPS